LELARTVMAEPSLILFDEPGAGVNRIERRILTDHIRRLVSEEGIAIFLIGHEMELVMDVCDPIIVMDRGKKLAEGSPDEVRSDPRVFEVYLGCGGHRDLPAWPGGLARGEGWCGPTTSKTPR